MKIAVIIVGIFDFNEQILNNVSKCYDLFSENTDIFIMNNNDDENNNKIRNYFGNKVKSVNSMRNIDLTEFNNLSSKDDELFKRNREIFINKLNNVVKPNLKFDSIHNQFTKFNTVNDIPKKNSFNQYFQTYRAIREIHDFENNNGFRYDYIMRIRLDFYLKNKKFGPNHFFNDTNDILFKDYDSIKNLYSKITEDDDYHHDYFRINNFCKLRTPKYLGGQYVLNKNSFEQIKDLRDNREEFNKKIKDKFFININDFCFFSARNNFIQTITDIVHNYDNFFNDKIMFTWLAPEVQFQLGILNEGLFYLDYLQFGSSFKNGSFYEDHAFGIENF